MQLSEITIDLTPRSNSEAVSLGFNVARKYFMPLFRIGLLAMLPLLVICMLLECFASSPAIGSILFWWCKPFFTRVILLRLSKLIFNQPSNAIQDIKASFANGLWLNLTFWRFSSLRHLYMPIQMLEQLHGADYSYRRKLIGKNTSGTAVAVTVALLHFSGFLAVNDIFLIYFFFPEHAFDLSNLLFKPDLVGYEYYNLFLFIVNAGAILVIEVFFASIGFMLYLNRRAILEGWDIDIKFKQIAIRLDRQRELLTNKSIINSVLLVVCVLLCSFSVTPNKAFAQGQYTSTSTQNSTTNSAANTDATATNEVKHIGSKVDSSSSKSNSSSSSSLSSFNTATAIAIDPKADKEQITKILNDDKISPYKIEKKYQLKKPLDFNSDKSNSDFDFNGWHLAWLLKFILILIPIVIAIYILIKRDFFKKMFTGNKVKPKSKQPNSLFGLQITQESLPENITANIANLIEKGDLVAALSLIYRATLSELVHYYEVNITYSDTEGDCLLKTKSKISYEQQQCFTTLTNAWQQLVYAHVTPDIQQINALATTWNSLFSAQNRVKIDAFSSEQNGKDSATKANNRAEKSK